MHQTNEDGGPGYLAEGEIPGDATIIFVGIEAALKPTWRDRRAARNRMRHFRCALRVGQKIVETGDGEVVVETAA